MAREVERRRKCNVVSFHLLLTILESTASRWDTVVKMESKSFRLSVSKVALFTIRARVWSSCSRTYGASLGKGSGKGVKMMGSLSSLSVQHHSLLHPRPLSPSPLPCFKYVSLTST